MPPPVSVSPAIMKYVVVPIAPTYKILHTIRSAVPILGCSVFCALYAANITKITANTASKAKDISEASDASIAAIIAKSEANMMAGAADSIKNEVMATTTNMMVAIDTAVGIDSNPD